MTKFKRSMYLRLKREAKYLGGGDIGVILSGLSGQVGASRRLSCRRAANTVLRMSIATVMGPTPPGTGVTCDATSVASS